MTFILHKVRKLVFNEKLLKLNFPLTEPNEPFSSSNLSTLSKSFSIGKLTFFIIDSMVKGRIQEAVRASKSYSDKPKPIYVYIRYVYADSRKLLSEVNILQLLIAWKRCHQFSFNVRCPVALELNECENNLISHSVQFNFPE